MCAIVGDAWQAAHVFFVIEPKKYFRQRRQLILAWRHDMCLSSVQKLWHAMICVNLKKAACNREERSARRQHEPGRLMIAANEFVAGRDAYDARRWGIILRAAGLWAVPLRNLIRGVCSAQPIRRRTLRGNAKDRSVSRWRRDKQVELT
jgi:hypothetical protein